MTTIHRITLRHPGRFPYWLRYQSRDTTLHCATYCGPIGAYSRGGARPALPLVREARQSARRVIGEMLASEILQDFVTRMADAVISERFETYSAGVHLPFSILTSAASLSVATLDDLEDGFDTFAEMVRIRGVTRIDQTVMYAEFESPDRIVGIYRTRLMDGPRDVLPEYYSKMWIQRIDGVWKTTRTHNTTKEARWPVLLTRLASDSWSPEEP